MARLMYTCDHESGTRCHACPQMGCLIMSRRFATADIGAGGIVVVHFLRIRHDGEFERVHAIMPVMEDGRVYLFPSVAMSVPEQVVRCVEAFVQASLS